MRQPDLEDAALTGAGAARRDGATVSLDECLDDREADAGAPVVPVPGLVGAVEPLEHERQVLGCDPGPGVLDLEDDGVLVV